MKVLKSIFLILCLFFLSSSTLYAKNFTFLTHFIMPFSYEENGEFKGFAVDLVKEMMKKMGHPQEFKMYPFGRALKKVQSTSRYALFITARRPERENTLKWVGPLIENGVYFYKRASSPITLHTLEDARKVRMIGVGRGNADDTYLKSQGFTNLFPTNDQMQSLQMLCRNRVDITPMGELVMPEMAKQAGIDESCIERTDLKLYDSVLYLAFSKETRDEVIQQWQHVLDELKYSGRYQELYDKYVK